MSGDLLTAAIGEATAAFAFADAVPVEAPPVRDALRFGIDLIAPMQGHLLAELSPSDADDLAKVAWGAFFEGRPDARDQFIFELLNVIAGSYLAMRWPDREVRIGFPQRLEVDTPLHTANSTAYDVGGATVRFAVERAEEAIAS